MQQPHVIVSWSWYIIEACFLCFSKTSCPKCDAAKTSQSTQTTFNNVDETVNRSLMSPMNVDRSSDIRHGQHLDDTWIDLNVSNSTVNNAYSNQHRRSYSNDGDAVRSKSLDISDLFLTPPLTPAHRRHRRSRSADTAVTSHSLDESSILYRLRSHDKHTESSRGYNGSQRDDGDLSIVWLWHRVPGGKINSFNLLNDGLKCLIMDRRMKPVRLYNLGKWRPLLKRGRCFKFVFITLTLLHLFLILLINRSRNTECTSSVGIPEIRISPTTGG